MEATPSCNDVLSAIPLYVGGDLDGLEARAIERHLSGCAPCRAELDRTNAARSALRTLVATTPPVPEIWSGLRLRMIEEGLLRAPAAPPAPAKRIDLWRWIPTAAAALLLAALGLVLAQRGGRGNATPDGIEGAPVAGVTQPIEFGPGSGGADFVPAQLVARPVALRPLGFDEWPTEQAMESELQRLPAAPFAQRPEALPASLPPGIH